MDEEFFEQNPDFKKLKISWWQRMLMKFAPKIFLRQVARKAEINSQKLEWAEKLFGDCQRIDFFPSRAPHRGLIIILDKKLALYFTQDGDHFTFDGFEIGEYEKGDVTIFDRIKG